MYVCVLGPNDAYGQRVQEIDTTNIKGKKGALEPGEPASRVGMERQCDDSRVIGPVIKVQSVPSIKPINLACLAKEGTSVATSSKLPLDFMLPSDR